MADIVSLDPKKSVIPSFIAKALGLPEPQPLNLTADLGPGAQGPPVPPEIAAAATQAPKPAPESLPVPPEIGGAIGATEAPKPTPAPDPLNDLVASETAGTGSRPQLAKPHKSFLQKVGAVLPTILDTAGAVGGGLEAAGSPGHEAPGATKLIQVGEADQARALARRKLNEVDIPEAQAKSQYYRDLNPTKVTVQQTKNEGALDTQGAKNEGALNLQGAKDKAAYQRELLRQGNPMIVDPELAQVAGQPDLAGKPLAGVALQNFVKILGAKGIHIQDLGTEGLWSVDKLGNRIKQVSVSSPSLARAVAGRQAGVTDVYDESGNLVPMTDAERLKRGLPKAQTEFSEQGPTASTRTAGQAAGGVASHIPAFRQSVANLAAKGQLGPVMGRLNDLLTRGYGGNDPDVSEFLTTVKLLKSGAVRAHFGAKGGAQILSSFDQILNPDMTPEALNGSLNGIESFLNTYGDIAKFTPKRGGAAKPAQNGGPKKGDPLGIL